jgi:hypothetical protein
VLTSGVWRITARKGLADPSSTHTRITIRPVGSLLITSHSTRAPVTAALLHDTTSTRGSNEASSPAADKPAAGGSVKLEQGACALLPAEEVSTAFGATFKAGTESNANPENSVCTFKNGGTYHAEYASADVASRYQTLSSSYQGTESVSGVGDKAFWVEDEKLLVSWPASECSTHSCRVHPIPIHRRATHR